MNTDTYRVDVSHDQPVRVAFDFERYGRRVQEGPCFVCAFLAGHPDYRHHTLYEDDDVVAFLARHPVQLGYCLVAPKRHVESWIDDMEEGSQSGSRRRRHRAVRADVFAESGSQQGNAHVHWHLAALPPGVPYQQQQFPALMAENGVLPVDDSSQAALARRIRGHL